MLYDTAGGLNLVSPGHKSLDHSIIQQHSQPLTLDTVSGSSRQRYNIMNLYLILENETREQVEQAPPGSIKDTVCYAIQAYETPFPFSASNPTLLQTKLRVVGERISKVPTPWEIEHLPSVCLGIEDLQKHPVEVEASKVPKSIRRKFPNAVIMRSKITGKLLLAGNITRPTTTYNLNLPRLEKGREEARLDSEVLTNTPAEENEFRTSEGITEVDSHGTIQLLNLLGNCLDREIMTGETNDLPDLDEVPKERLIDNSVKLTEGPTKLTTTRVDPHSLSCNLPCMSKLFSTESKTFRANEFMYKMYISDLKDLFNTDASRSLDLIDPGRVGCSRCDFRHSILTDTPLANNSLLSRQLMWIPLEGRKGGIFAINRLFRAAIKHFPSCERVCKMDTLRLVQKLQKRPHTAQDLTFRLRRDYLSGHCTFLTPSEQEQLKEKGYVTDQGQRIRPIYLPQHCVYNPLSLSTPARLVSVPNRTVLQDDGTMKTYNDLLRNYNMNMNDIELLQISQQMALDTIGVDILDAFKSCSNTYATSIRCLTIALKDPKDGLPTYLTEKREVNLGDLEVLRWDRATYGINDLPKLYSAALGRCVEAFKSRSQDNIAEDLLEEVQRCLINLSYCDDLQISSLHNKSVEFARKRGMSPPELSAEDREKQVTDPHFISEEYCQQYDIFLGKVSSLYLFEVTKALIKVLAFSNFYLKSIDTRDIALRNSLNNETILMKPAVTRVPDMKRPEAHLVHKEAGVKTKNIKKEMNERPPGHPSPIYLTQLSRNFHEDGKLTLKTRHLSLDLTHKNPLSFVYTTQQFIQHLKTKNTKMNKRFLYSISGQFYDNLGIQLMGPKSAIKVACHQLHAGPNGTTVDWDDLVGEKIEAIIMIAVDWYFYAVNQTLNRVNLYNYQSAGHLLVAQSDAGKCNHAQMHFLVSFIHLNGVYRAKTQLLMAKPYVNQTSCRSIPYFELLSLAKSVGTAVQLMDWLKTLGIIIHPCNVLILCDAQTALIQARSRAAMFTTRVSHLVAKLALKLMQGGMCPFRNLYFFHQEKNLFHVDLLTKLPAASAVRQTETKLRDYSWLNSDPKGWDHITRGALPACSDKELIQDIELNKDYIEESEQVIAQFQKASRELYKPDSYLDPTDQTPHLTPTNENNPTELMQKLNSHPGPLDGRTIQLITAPDEDKPFSQLLLRRMSFGLDRTGSAVRILARVYFFVKRLQYLCELNPDTKKPIKERMLQSLSAMREKYSPWCLSHSCNPPLSKRQGSRNNCLNPNHHRVVEDKSCLQLPTVIVEDKIEDVDDVDVNVDTNVDVDDLENTEVSIDEGTDPDHHLTTPERDEASNELEDETRGGIAAPTLDFPTPMSIRTHLDIQVKQLVSTPWDTHCENTFEAVVLQFLCCHYRTDQAYAKGVRVYTTDLSPELTTHWSMGRMQRCRADPTSPVNTGRLLVRLIDPDSVLGQLTIRSAHEYSDIHQTHGVHLEKSVSYLLQKGLYFRSPRKQLDTFGRNCQTCIVNKATVGKNVHRIVRSRSGPSEALSTLANSQCNTNSAIVDLCGPFYITCLTNKCVKKVWTLVLVNGLGRLNLSVLRDYSSQAVLEALLSYCNTYGSLNFLASDDGTHFAPFHSAVSPLAEGSKTPRKIDAVWSKLLEGSAQRSFRQEAGSSFRKYVAGRHACVAAAERMVHSLKVFLIKCHLFKRRFKKQKPNMDVLMFQYFLSKIQHLANSRPLFLHKNMLLGIEDISIVSQLSSPHTGSSGLTNNKDAASDPEMFTKRLDKMQTMTNTLMVDMAHHLSPLLLEVEPTHQTNQDGPLDINLAIGDVVLDRRNLILSGNITGSMGRIQLIGEDARWCLIARIRPKLLSKEARRLCNAIKRGWKLEANRKTRHKVFETVGRQCTDLFLIAKHQSVTGDRYITFNQGSKIFDFNLCLAKIANKNYAPHCIPPEDFQPTQTEKDNFLQNPEEWVEVETPEWGEDDVIHGDTDSETGDSDTDQTSDDEIEDEAELPDPDDDQEDNPTEPTQTRSGRVSKKPTRFGFLAPTG